MKDVKINRYKQLAVGAMLTAVILLGGVLLLSTLAGRPEPRASGVAATQQRAGYVSYTGQTGKTVLQQLKVTASEVVTKSSSYGEYVQSIGAFNAGTDGKYWTFYVDGKMAAVGAGAYVAKGGEKIEWKFEKAQ